MSKDKTLRDFANALKSLSQPPPPSRASQAKRKRQRQAPGKGFQIRVDLDHSKPPIWRRLLVPSGTDLGQLHGILQISMGWHDGHLHAFRIGDQEYSPASYDEFAPPNFFRPAPVDERQVIIDEIFTRPNMKVKYEYDFGDSWTHTLKFEKRIDDIIDRPTIIAGRRACPPEDCGGMWGYQDLIEIMADPKHSEHDGMREWLGHDLDPERFDIEHHNAALRDQRA